MQVVIPWESSLKERDPDLIWSPPETLSNDMTAIALVYTEAGFVIAADGRMRYTDDSNPLTKLLPPQRQPG